MKSTAIGSAVSVLLVFSAISYARIQEPKPVQTSQQQIQTSNQPPSTPVVDVDPNSAPAISETKTPTDEAATDFEVAPETYTATAYSLRGRTASGRPVSRGLIAADPRILPLGTRVRLDAGNFTGEYVVADTGGAVKGRRIDIWTPTAGEAMRFGRRAVKLTVLSFGGRRSKSRTVRPRVVNPLTITSTLAPSQVK
jgi:3D (Asp-Asp-Asp) domain-containing protein